VRARLQQGRGQHSVPPGHLAPPSVVGAGLVCDNGVHQQLRGAERQANSFLSILDRFPDIRAALRASILVADRRWDIILRNGIDVHLPETDVAPALERLVALDREKKLLSRDITAVDLRLPDRVNVRLTDAAAQARDDALREKDKKKK